MLVTRQALRDKGIFYKLAEKDKSSLYMDSLPFFNSRKVRLLDNRVLIGQLCALERRPSSNGKDKIDHMRGAHDDIANSVCGAVCLATQKRRRFEQQVGIGLPVCFEDGVMLRPDGSNPMKVWLGWV